jgi:hypothetical protein
MNMVEEYLRAVSVLLPRETRDDIVAELRDVVLTRLESRAAQLGRAPSDEETEAVLREIGHPLVVAARYRDEPQYVVGPMLYPFWMFGVKIAVALQCAIACLVFIIHVLGGEPFGVAFGQALADAFEGALTLIGLATVVAWLADRGTVTLPYVHRWRVRDLKLFDIAGWDWGALRRGTPEALKRRPGFGSLATPSVGEAIGQIAWGVVFLMWWLGALHVLGSTAGHLQVFGLVEGSLAGFDWVGLKAMLFAPVTVYAVATVLSGAVALARPQLLALEGALDLGNGAALVITAWWLGYASPLASRLKIESVADIAIAARAGLQHGKPFELPVLVGLFLLILGLSGVLRAATGVWKLCTALTRFPLGAIRPQVKSI